MKGRFPAIAAAGVAAALLTACGTTTHTQRMSTNAIHACPPRALTVVSTSSGVLMGTDTGIVFTLRNVSASTCRVGGYPPVYLRGRLMQHGVNVVDVVGGNLVPGASASFAVVNSYIQPQKAPMARCPTWPRPSALILGGVTIGHFADVQDFCNRTFVTPIGVQGG